MNPQAFLQLDRVIHEKGRLALMSMLAASPELSFTEMRDALNMTDGNLTTHIRTLQEAGYVSVTKSFQNNRPLTTCALTPAGKKAFTSYINLLEEIIQQTKSK
ncbi:MAG TPA: transcriptional regulator [Candidatus Sulfotelmatobacter sp.]|nr:transcriptional regulator [Candidatus Sulfotelmatobacter sp.]HWI58817.1 transcriptional regulator [Bacillota bacterium]